MQQSRPQPDPGNDQGVEDADSAWTKCYNISMNLVSYFRSTIDELKQVRWPTRQETIKLTLIVLGISLFVGAYVGGLDYLFTNLLTYILK